MNGRVRFFSWLAVGTLLLGAQVAVGSTDAAKGTGESKAPAARSAQRSQIRRVRGEVTAVEPQASPMTLTLKTMMGNQELIVGVDVTDKTMIRGGKIRKSLGDIQVGDRVWLQYERTNDTLVADAIRIM